MIFRVGRDVLHLRFRLPFLGFFIARERGLFSCRAVDNIARLIPFPRQRWKAKRLRSLRLLLWLLLQAPARLVDSKGALAGITTFILKHAQNLNFAIAGNDAEAVMLDFVQPLAAGWQFVGFGRKARRDEASREGTLQHPY
jgi:hypothetical protein